jgi:hypothetical protein
MSEEIRKYQRQWELYRDKKGRGCFMAIIILPVPGTLVYISRNFPHYGNAALFGIILVFGVSAVIFFLREISNALAAKVILIIKRRILRLKNVSIVNCRFFTVLHIFSITGELNAATI